MQEIKPGITLAPQHNALKNFWHKAKWWLIVLAMIGLGTLNILSLVSESIHEAGYRAIKTALTFAVADEMVSRLLRDSPTVKRKSDVVVATKSLSEENSMLAASKRALDIKHVSLEKFNQEIKSKNAELTRVSAIRSASAQKISKRLAIRSVANATRNSSSVLAEAIPYAGVAIVVGVTALDLQDACETLKDMNELNIAFGHEQEDQTKVCGMKLPTKDEALAQAKGSWNAIYQAAADALKKGGAAVASATHP